MKKEQVDYKENLIGELCRNKFEIYRWRIGDIVIMTAEQQNNVSSNSGGASIVAIKWYF